jgi:hypothetical protein
LFIKYCTSEGIGTYVIQLSNIFLDPFVLDLNTPLLTWNSDLINLSRVELHCHVKRQVKGGRGIMMYGWKFEVKFFTKFKVGAY